MPAALRDFSFFSETSIPALGHTQTLFSSYRGSRGVKQPELPVDHPPPCSAKVKNEWSCTSAPPVFFHGVDRDCFAFITSGPDPVIH
jgi:hypothetical protein